LTEKIPPLNFFLLGSTVLHLSKPDQVDEYGKSFNEILVPIEETLQKIIKINHDQL